MNSYCIWQGKYAEGDQNSTDKEKMMRSVLARLLSKTKAGPEERASARFRSPLLAPTVPVIDSFEHAADIH